jgi:hypothetical protein
MAVMVIPEALRVRLGDEASKGFTDVIKEIDLEARKDALAIAEERLEKKLTVEIGKVRVDIGSDIGKVRVEIGSVRVDIANEIGKVRVEIGSEIGSVRSEIGKLRVDIGSDIGKVREDMLRLEGRINERMASLEGSNRLEMEKLRVEVAKYGVETAKSGTEIIRWMFLFWIGQIAVIATLFKFFSK